jgi:hypothetical protein
MEAHPIADLFPMLAEDELAELADDIKQRGLLQPIVLDTDGKVLDGRNRLAACKRAGVKPDFVNYEGDDAQGYALAVNINRRSMSKGQTALVVARAYKNYTLDDLLTFGVSKQYVSWARQVLDYAPDKADSVLTGTTPLAEAYEVARLRKKAAADEDAVMADVRAESPELAHRVIEGELGLEAALRALEEQRKEAAIRDRVTDIDAARDADGAPSPSFSKRVEDGILTWAEALTLAEQWIVERNAAVRRAQDALLSVVTHWGAIRTVAESPDSPYVADILAGLGETDRAALDRVLASLDGGDR